jgi:hypothetical protein
MIINQKEEEMEVGQRRNTQNKTVEEQAGLLHNPYKL